MSTTVHFTTNEHSVRNRSIVGRWRRWADPATTGIARGWRAFVRYKRLAKLTDEALAARGLQRHEIGRHVFFENDKEG
jgi:hypothetical protein